MAAHDIPLPKAMLVALWMESILYGIYAVLFAIAIYILVTRRANAHRVNKVLVILICAMFAMATVHIAVELVRAIQAFIDHTRPGAEGADRYYSDTRNGLFILGDVLYAANTIAADSLLIYRCYIVWQRNKLVVAFPLLLLVTGMGITPVVLISESELRSIFAKKVQPLITTFFVLSLSLNIIVTTLIALRIWHIFKKTHRVLGEEHSMKYRRVAAIVIESGSLYSLTMLVLLMLYLGRFNSEHILISTAVQITGIVSTLIVVRVGLGISTDHTDHNIPGSSARFSLAVLPPTLNVSVTRDVVRKRDAGDESPGDSPWSPAAKSIDKSHWSPGAESEADTVV